MFPSLRLGYLVLPWHLVRQVREYKRLADHHSNSIYQLALAGFIEGGDLERHIRRMKREYRKRRDYLYSLLQCCFDGKVKIYGGQAGMHIVAEFSNMIFTSEFIQQLAAEGVYAVSVETHSITKWLHQNQIILGYAGLAYPEIEKGIHILEKKLELV